MKILHLFYSNNFLRELSQLLVAEDPPEGVDGVDQEAGELHEANDRDVGDLGDAHYGHTPEHVAQGRPEAN